MKRTIYPYAAVRTVRLNCETSDMGSRQIGYEILLPGDTHRDLLNERTLSARLEAALKVDAKLREVNAQFLFDLPDQQPHRNINVVDRACVLDLAANLDEASREKLEQLFHLDEWFERRWRMRTGTLYVAGP